MKRQKSSRIEHTAGTLQRRMLESLDVRLMPNTAGTYQIVRERHLQTDRQEDEGRASVVASQPLPEEVLGTLTIDAHSVHFAPAQPTDDPLDLQFVRRAFGISDEELADLFKIRRASIAGWREHGIPLNRRASVARLVELARVLVRDVRNERLPEIVRTPDEWLGGKTILETIADAGVEPVYAYLRRLFSYS